MTETSGIPYRAEDFTVEIPVEEYVRRFRDVDRFMPCCRACPNYGRVWACPPFDRDIDRELGRYSRALIVATKITPLDTGLPLSESQRLIRPERLRLESRLRQMERQCGGRSFAYAGSCLYCPEGTCTRTAGLPCRHPDKVRPSLEAYGFDIGRTTAELFGIDLLWSTDGHIPVYLTLVTALLHNAPAVPF